MRDIAYLGAGGLRLAADAQGDAQNPPVVFIPGAGQTRHAWRRTAAIAAARGYYAISLDLRGHGGSAWAPDGDYSLDAFAGDVLAVAKSLREPPILVGASIGGIASLVAVGESNIPVARALVLVDVVPQMPGEGLDRIRAFMSAGAQGFATADEASAAIQKYLPHRRPAGTGAGRGNNLRRGDDGRLYWHWDPAFHAGSKRRADEGMLPRMGRAAGGVCVPTLLISGARSEVVNHAGVRHLLGLIPQATWARVPDAAHMVVGDENDAFNEALSDFIIRLPSTRAAYTT
jgi:pimeloyl-ACP methyl ester carboxylesterase